MAGNSAILQVVIHWFQGRWCAMQARANDVGAPSLRTLIGKERNGDKDQSGKVPLPDLLLFAWTPTINFPPRSSALNQIRESFPQLPAALR